MVYLPRPPKGTLVPFEQHIPRSLSASNIQTYAPMASGVYGISNGREWIYIGVTDDIRGSLIHHLRDGHTPLMQRRPTGFVYETCDAAHRTIRQDRLIQEYEPAFNRGTKARPRVPARGVR